MKKAFSLMDLGKGLDDYFYGSKKTKKRRSKRKAKRVPLKKVEHFHRHKRKIPGTILSTVDDREIIYGAQALNIRFPSWLDRPTQDYDIYSTKPKKDAHQAERALDRRFGGDFFFVEKALYPHTWRVKSHVNRETYADYTKRKKKIPHDKIRGKKYVKLSHVKKDIKKTLKDPEAAYRHDKDKDALNRIRIYERLKEKKN